MISLKFKKRQKKLRLNRSQWPVYLLLSPMVLMSILPILYIVFTAFKPIGELFAYPPKFITLRPTWDNFRKLFEASEDTIFPLSMYLFNSIVSTLAVVFIGLAIAVAAAYALMHLVGMDNSANSLLALGIEPDHIQKTGAGLEYDSFSGAWCMAAAAYYSHLTGDRSRVSELLHSESWYYDAYVRRQECYGGPLDIDKNIDSEGILAYIREDGKTEFDSKAKF